MRANPVEYAQRYGDQLKQPDEFPQFVNDIKTPEGSKNKTKLNLNFLISYLIVSNKGIILASDQSKSQLTITAAGVNSSVHELYGDVEALQLIDLDREGLSEYRDQLTNTLLTQTNTATNHPNRLQNTFTTSHYHLSHSTSIPTHSAFGSLANSSPPSNRTTTMSMNRTYSTHEASPRRTPQQRPGVSAPSIRRHLNQSQRLSSASAIIKAHVLDDEQKSQIINHLLDDEFINPRRLSVEEAEKSLLRVNSRLGRRLGQDDVKLFFAKLDVDSDGTLDPSEFKSALIRINKS